MVLNTPCIFRERRRGRNIHPLQCVLSERYSGQRITLTFPLNRPGNKSQSLGSNSLVAELAKDCPRQGK